MKQKRKGNKIKQLNIHNLYFTMRANDTTQTNTNQITNNITTQPTQVDSRNSAHVARLGASVQQRDARRVGLACEGGGGDEDIY